MSIQQYALLDVSAHTIDHRRTTRSRSRSHTAHRVRILSRCRRNCSRGLAGFESKNDTTHTYQIVIDFDSKTMYGKILSDSTRCFDYKIYNQSLRYVREKRQSR